VVQISVSFTPDGGVEREVSASEYAELSAAEIAGSVFGNVWITLPDGARYAMPAREARWLRFGARARHVNSGAWPVPA
jgi:hypothetical protein